MDECSFLSVNDDQGRFEMINFKEVRKNNGGMVCRACLNAEYDVKLTPKDCTYYSGENKCARCRVIKHIVRKLRFSGKMKTLFK